jgi:gas vesicle protein
MGNPKIVKKAFRLLTGVIIGGAIGSILGMAMAPKKGKELREKLKDASMDLFLSKKRGNDFPDEDKK